jgi:RNA recognition motif-containing protein
MKNLFVGNTSFQTTENELRSLLETFGEFTQIRVMTDRVTRQARGFGFVKMTNDDEAAKAISGLNFRVEWQRHEWTSPERQRSAPQDVAQWTATWWREKLPR